jgi:hypothetical protein
MRRAAATAQDVESTDMRAWFETLDEDAATELLLRRFRWFVSTGHDLLDALMLATRPNVGAY